MKKVLVITYYWPPSGGAGVQRWLKMSKYLSRQGVEVFILTVDKNYAAFPDYDNSLTRDVDPQLKVYTTKATNYFKFYEKMVGKENIPKAGFSNVDPSKISNKIIGKLRSHIFIPDPRKGWNKYALKKAKELIQENDIKNVITSSPPHSTQLIGLKLKSTFPKINWISDMRDPWTDIYYYYLLGHSYFSKSIDRSYERKVFIECDTITTVSYGLKDIFTSKANVDIDPDKVKVITNGFDSEDFAGLENIDEGKFVIAYTGTMSEQYSPEVFLKAYVKLQMEYGDKLTLRFIGKLSEGIAEYARKLGVNFEFIPQVPHDEIIRYQLSANLLLLVIPDVPNNTGIITGKMFEYLASRNNIVVIGPKDGEAAKYVSIVGAGKTFSRDEEEEIRSFISNLIKQYYKVGKELISSEKVKQFDRSNQAGEFLALLK